MIVLWFYAPLVIYLVLYLLWRERLRSLSLLLAALIALVSFAAVLWRVFFSPHWPEGTQITWTGVESSSGPIIIGGSQEDAITAWPNGSFSPSLKILTAGERDASLEISEGNAFVKDDAQDTFLNGVVLGRGESKTVDNYTVRVRRGIIKFWRQYAEIAGPDNQVVETLSFPIYSIDRDHVYSLQTLLDRNIDLHTDVPKLVKAEEWADGKRLLLTKYGELRLLGKELQQAGCHLPCQLTLLWPAQSLPLGVTKDGNKLTIAFLPPWRRASPVPPNVTNQPTELVVTGRPRPNDTAFLLPLGHGAPDPRATLIISKSVEGAPVISSPGANNAVQRKRDYLPPGIEKHPATPFEIAKGATSQFGVQVGSAAFIIATVKDLPSPSKLTLLILLAFGCFVAGLGIVAARMPDATTRWVIGGLAAALWNLLLFRLLLAMRYALEPDHLDYLAVKGVTSSLVGLAVVPGLILLGARLTRDVFARPRDLPGSKKALLASGLYLLFLLAAFFIEYASVPHLWANLPARFVPALGFKFIALSFAFTLYCIGSILVLYGTKSDDPRYQLSRKVFLAPLTLIESISQIGKRRWQVVASEPRRLTRLIAYLILAFLFFFVAPFVIAGFPGGEFPREVIVLILFCWLTALLWLSSRLAFRPDRERQLPSLWVLLFCAAITIVPAIFVIPLAIRDAGSVLATLAIFLSLAPLLLLIRPWRFGAIPLATLICGFAIGVVAYSNLQFFIPFLPGEAPARLLDFKEGSAVQRYILFAKAVGDGEGLSAQKLRNGYQHAWENRAVAHEGGLLGLGFGNAPSRRSQIRQDTIQYDSTFSFFVLSEYGLIGGALVIGVYAAPLLLILAGGRQRFDFGYAVATMIASTALLEAVLHAGMNTGAFPLTGRNLPLLSVNSITDLARWALLFFFSAQAVLLRYANKDYGPEAVSMISPVTTRHLDSVEPARRYLVLSGVVLLAPLVLAIFALWTGLTNVFDPELDKPFTWEGIAEVVQRMAGDGTIKVNQNDLTLGIDSRIKVSAGDLIQQEVTRFNALPVAERLGDVRDLLFAQHISQVKSLSDYQQLLDQARRDSSAETEPRRPSLFRLLPPPKWADEGYASGAQGYTVAPNPAFNTRVSFKEGMDQKDVPRVTFRDGQEILIGPAWVMGRWVAATNPDSTLPWTGYLADALAIEWSRLGSREAARRYGVLTIDRRLHEAAARFVSLKGRSLHDDLLGRHAANRSDSNLPPRVALAIISLPAGEVLALGGWPRMTSERFWKRSEDHQEWLPSTVWLEQKAPQAFRLEYGGDRNFDRMVVGSATKPIWAAAALRVHPNIDQKLRVRGTDSQETSVFGINISPQFPWHVTPRSSWVDFTNYLAQSDNRYQVRLGFLALADEPGANVVGVGSSGSEKESLDGARLTPWRKYPRFHSFIGFSADQPKQLSRLDETPLADRLEKMFSIGVGRSEFHYRRSFWTLNESDDVLAPESGFFLFRRGRPTDLFNSIAPQAAVFRLNKISSPRDYVSLLLGGGTNLWSNVDFAAAFGSCISGSPLLAHIVTGSQQVRPLAERENFPDIAARLRPGLAAVVSNGTASRPLRDTGALTFLNGLPGVKVYAKTGTLKALEGARETSRIVMALVRWENEPRGQIKSGLLFSLVGEQAEMGTATRWLGEFLMQNRSDIERLLNPEARSKRRSSMPARITFFVRCRRLRPPSLQSDSDFCAVLDFDDGIESGGVFGTHSINKPLPNFVQWHLETWLVYPDVLVCCDSRNTEWGSHVA